MVVMVMSSQEDAARATSGELSHSVHESCSVIREAEDKQDNIAFFGGSLEIRLLTMAGPVRSVHAS